MILAIAALTILVLLAAIMIKMYMVMSKVEATKNSISCKFFSMQIVGLLCYVAHYIGQCTIFLMHYLSHEGDGAEAYHTVKKALILETVGTVANLFNMTLVAVVLHRASGRVGLQRDPYLNCDVSLLTYLRN